MQQFQGLPYYVALQFSCELFGSVVDFDCGIVMWIYIAWRLVRRPVVLSDFVLLTVQLA